MVNFDESIIKEVFLLPKLVLLEETENHGFKLTPDHFTGNNFYKGLDAFVSFDKPQFTENTLRKQFFFHDFKGKEEFEFSLGMIVDEDMLNNMFLNLTNRDGEEVYIDIRQ